MARSLRVLCAAEQSAACSATTSAVIHADLRPIIVTAEVAALIGLAFCELLRNALTHAFPCGSTGHVGVHLWPVISLPGVRAYVLIADDGQGFSDEPPAASDSGIPLARHLVEGCGGTLTREPGSGTVWRVTLPPAAGVAVEDGYRAAPEPLRPAHFRIGRAQPFSRSRSNTMRFLSTRVHGAIGYRAVALLIISPWLFGSAALVWLPHLVSGLFEGAASLTTQTVPGAGTRQQGLGAGA